jgi:hypothetical protein
MGWMENATASRYCRADVKWINGCSPPTSQAF